MIIYLALISFIEIGNFFITKTLSAETEKCFLKNKNKECFSCYTEYFSPYESNFLNVSFPSESCKLKLEGHLELEIFVFDRICSGISKCEGTYHDPFDNLFSALSYVHEKVSQYNDSNVNITLIGENHFIFAKDIDEAKVEFLFRRRNISLTIKPLYCNNTYGDKWKCFENYGGYQSLIL